MLRYLLNKVAIFFISVFAVVATISFIVYQAPVDPASLQFGQRTDPEALAKLRADYFLDRPFVVQVGKYLEDLSPLQLIHGEDSRKLAYNSVTFFSIGKYEFIAKWPYLRKSYVSGDPVSDLIQEAFPSTLVLGLASMLFAFIFGLLFGIIAALNRDRFIDQFILSMTTLFYSVPSYISAILCAILFGYYLREETGLPIQGSIYGLDDFGNEITDWSKLVLPALALGIRPVAMICQMTRASLIDAMNEPFALTAKAYGIRKPTLLFRQVFPNAWNPIITTLSGWLASLLTGAFFVEYVFNFRGLGDLTIQSLSQFDVPVVLGCCVVTVTVFILINLFVDLLYALSDPRIKI
ncbi:MAG: ABC transporter permease [Saprospiraceae bacterium]|nr:ABC transporter permease [Saprospiraceae bacterium]